jgi:extradiol dioxygenase family protein
MSRPRFHLAFPVRDLAEARAFYGGILGCPEGRSAPDWVDFDFHGHQIVAHLAPDEVAHRTNSVDGEAVPVRHFGLILAPDVWRQLAERLTAAGTRFLIKPQTRFAGQAGEQSTLFVTDPSGNALEFKAFADDTQVFATGGAR